MSVSREEALRIAQLAELDVDDAALPELAEQMSRIGRASCRERV